MGGLSSALLFCYHERERGVAGLQPFEIGRLTRLDLGYVGETGSREIQIDMSEWLERWPDGRIAVDVLKPGRKEYYLADTTVEDGILTWTVTYTDVAKAGRGMAQISIYDFGSGKVYKSRCVETIIRESADMAEDLEAPHPMDTWVARAVEAKEGALGAALSAAQSASVAKAAETVVVEARDRAEAAAAAAENSETIAANASANATEKAAEASASAEAAERYASDAEAANDEVQAKASEVRDNADRAEAAAEGLETAVTEAVKAKNTATEQAGIAKTAAQNASVAVNNATTAAIAAADYAAAAQNASGAAENAAGAALNAMGGAGNAMTQAQESAAAAENAANEAKAAADSIPEDYTELVNIATTRAPGILQEASGDVASFWDGDAMPAQAIVSQIVAAQAGSGDPSPDNVRTISGWKTVNVTRVGKNLVDIPDIADTMGNLIRANTKAAFEAVPYKADTQYTFSADIETAATDALHGIEILYSDGTKTYFWMNSNGSQTEKSVTSTAGKTIASILFTYNVARTVTVRNVQLEEGTAATAYEPYQDVTLTATPPQTVYGGSLNWTTGVLTVTHVGKAVRAADISYKYGTSMTGWQTSCFVTAADTSLAPGRLASVCSHFQNTMDTAFTAGSATHGIFSDHQTLTTKYFAWGDPDATVEDFQAWLEEQYEAGTPVALVSPRSEAYTIQLTPQQLYLLKGSNSLWSDCGDTSVIYIADTKMYIDNALAAIAASIIDA